MSIDKPTREQLKEWNSKLAAEGLSLWRGHENEQNHTVYVPDTDVFQTPPKSGRLARYRLGEKVSHRKTCVVCETSFSAKRNDAKVCSQNCHNFLAVFRSLPEEGLIERLVALRRDKTVKREEETAQ